MSFLKWIVLVLCLNACSEPTLYHDLSGKTYQMDDFRGKWLIINYWASWCPSCEKEIPMFNELSAQYTKQLRIVGINYDVNEHPQLMTLRDRYQIHYTLMTDNLGEAYGFNDVRGLPTTLLINPAGHVVATYLGEQPKQKILQAMSLPTAQVKKS